MTQRRYGPHRQPVESVRPAAALPPADATLLLLKGLNILLAQAEQARLAPAIRILAAARAELAAWAADQPAQATKSDALIYERLFAGGYRG